MERKERLTIKQAFGLYIVTRQVFVHSTGRWADCDPNGTSFRTREQASAYIRERKAKDAAKAKQEAADREAEAAGRLSYRVLILDGRSGTVLTTETAANRREVLRIEDRWADKTTGTQFYDFRTERIEGSN
jgi:hypothetical protein